MIDVAGFAGVGSRTLIFAAYECARKHFSDSQPRVSLASDTIKSVGAWLRGQATTNDIMNAIEELDAAGNANRCVEWTDFAVAHALCEAAMSANDMPSVVGQIAGMVPFYALEELAYLLERSRWSEPEFGRAAARYAAIVRKIIPVKMVIAALEAR